MISIIIGLILIIATIGMFTWAGVISYKNDNRIKRNWAKYAIGVVFLISLLIVPFSIKQINTGEIAVVKVFGETQYTRSAGIHFDDYITREYIIYDLKTQEINQVIPCYSQDAQAVDVEMSFQYRIQSDKVINITEIYGSNEILQQRILAIINDRTKGVISTKQAMAIVEERAELSNDITMAIGELLNTYYIDIVNIRITDLCFSEAFETAVENKMIAEQEQLQAEYEKERLITQAEATLEVARKEAEASIVKANGDAEALVIMQNAWDSLAPEVKQAMLAQLAIETWDGKLPETMVGTDFIEWLFGQIGGQ